MVRFENEGHLILSRRIDEEIVVDGPAVLSVVSTRGNVQRISIRAPKSTRILRGELIEKDKRPAA
jgi:carbon storage regulator CsrA